MGEAVKVKVPEKYKKQQSVERMDDNNPLVSETDLTGKAEYIVLSEISSPKRNKK
ncbi:hypothetical protein BH09PAT2_BH09PAT2_04440 [soil metagenome]